MPTSSLSPATTQKEDAIKNEVPSANVRPAHPLSSPAAIRKAAAEVNAFPEPLHPDINYNAATTIGPFKLTADNIESQFATNHIGPFLFTKLLSSKPLATRAAQYTPRVVFISAAGHAFRDGLNFSTLERPDPKDYDALNAYFQTTVANILTGNVYSLHPGGAATTVAAAFDPGFNDNPGAYLENCIVANEKIAPHSSDPENAERLWILTEKITGERFTF
ncbi:hypothetical protein B0H14DRAFT_3441058 [Mycena olivaceomarginata]|nr:hypothetical protein B0H14DRAFT_3441058 [Mycena olivaceomarginata]